MPSSHIRQVENYSLATPNLHPLNKKHERPKAVFRDRHVQVQQHVSPCACESHGPWSSPPFRSNLDIWTETVCCARELYCRNLIHALQYGINFYLDYLSRWPDLCYVQEAPSGRMMGYSTRLTLRVSPIDFHSLPHKKKKIVLGKAEGNATEWHGHITALTVAPEYRRLSLARNMVSRLELVSDQHYKGFFVDLYVRCNNALAISMYEGFGYSVFRRVREYYGSLGVGKGGRDEEDAFGGSHCPHVWYFPSFISSLLPQTCGNLSREIPLDAPCAPTGVKSSSAQVVYHDCHLSLRPQHLYLSHGTPPFHIDNETSRIKHITYILKGGGSSGPRAAISSS